MKTTAHIQFDFIQAIRDADEVDEVADNVGKLAQRDLENTIQELAAAWKGDSAKNYLSKANRLQSEIDKTSRELHGIADNIRTVARIIYEAEMDAVRIANEDTSI